MALNSVFVDTSFFKAIIDPKDDFYQEGKEILNKLQKEKVTLVTSNYVLDESFTLIRKRCGQDMVDKFRKDLSKSAMVVIIIRVTVSDESEAWNWFLLDWSDLSFTDCVSFAVMKRLSINRAATFDQHFQRAGFKIEES